MGLESQDIARRIRAVLKDLDVVPVDPDTLADHDDLYDAGLRSLGAVRLLVALEAEFGVEFSDSVLHRGAFATVGHIREAVGALAAAGPPPSDRR